MFLLFLVIERQKNVFLSIHDKLTINFVEQDENMM